MVDKEKNYRNWQISRRRLLRIIAATGAAAVVFGPFLPSLANQIINGSAASDGKESGRLRRWGMIIDLRRCDGCQSVNLPPQCTRACIEGRFTPEPMEWIEVYEHDLPGGGTQFIPTPCMQCQNPPCVNVCPVGATWSTPEGVVLIDQNRCIGCRICMAACPYERRFFTWGQPPIPVEAKYVKYSPEHQIPLKRGVVAKCDFCPEMLRAGSLPFCAQGCPKGALYFGDLEEDLATNGREVVQFSTFLSGNAAYRHKEALGTRPRVYYVPGYGQEVGRTPYQRGKKPTEWTWKEVLPGAKTWKRSGR